VFFLAAGRQVCRGKPDLARDWESAELIYKIWGRKVKRKVRSVEGQVASVNRQICRAHGA